MDETLIKIAEHTFVAIWITLGVLGNSVLQIFLSIFNDIVAVELVHAMIDRLF